MPEFRVSLIPINFSYVSGKTLPARETGKQKIDSLNGNISITEDLNLGIRVAQYKVESILEAGKCPDED